MENLTFFKGLESSFFFTFPSLKEREGWDGSVTFCSFAALRVTAGGRNP